MLVKSKEEPVYSLQSLLFDERITQLPFLQSRYTPSMEAEDILAAVHTVPAYNRIPALLFSALAAAKGHGAAYSVARRRLATSQA